MTLEPVWLHEHPHAGAPEFRLGRDGDHVVAEWVGIGTLRADPQGASGIFVPVAGARDEEVARTVLGTAGAFLRHLRGQLAFHGSCVAFADDRGDRAVAFLGASGEGKSTLAAHLCLRNGARLVADDLVYLDFDARGAYVTPTTRTHRLLADARATLGMPASDPRKIDVDAVMACVSPVPLAAIFALSYEDGSGTVEPLRGLAAFQALTGSLFRFILDDPGIQRRDFDRLADVAKVVPAFELRRPRGLQHLALSESLIQNVLGRRDG